MASNETAVTAGRFSPEAVGIACAIVGTTMLSTKPILVKLAYAGGMGPDGVIGLRMAMSLPFFLVVGYLSWARLGRPVSPGIVAGTAITGLLTFYGAAYLDLVALSHISSQLERIVLFTFPTWVILLGALFFGEAITRRKLIALGLAYLGVVIIVSHDFAVEGGEILFGIACVFAATLVFSLYMLLSKAYIAALGTGLFTSIAMGASSFVIAVHLAATGSYDKLAVSPEMYALIFALAIGATAVPTYFMGAAVARIGAGPASIVATLGPPVTSLFAVAILGEAFTPYHAVGLALTCAGIVVLTWKGSGLRLRVFGP